MTTALPDLESGIIKAAVGWLRDAERRDAISFAKGYALKHFDAPDAAWFAVLPFLGGHLWEVHEGGPGNSYLAPAVRALTEGSERAWFQVGNRVHSISLRDGEPSCVLLSSEDSRRIIDAGVGRIAPRGKMTRVVKQGTGTLVFGSTVFGSGFLFLLASLTFYVAGEALAPDARRLDLDALPHRAWAKVERIPPNLFVDSLKYDKKAWNPNIRPILPKGAAPAAAPGAAPTTASAAPQQPPRPAQPAPVQPPSVPPAPSAPGVVAPPAPVVPPAPPAVAPAVTPAPAPVPAAPAVQPRPAPAPVQAAPAAQRPATPPPLAPPLAPTAPQGATRP